MNEPEASDSAPLSPEERLDLSLASRFDFLTFLRSEDLAGEAMGGTGEDATSDFVSVDSSTCAEVVLVWRRAFLCVEVVEASEAAEPSASFSA